MSTAIAIGLFIIGAIMIVIDLILSLNTPIDQHYLLETDTGYNYQEGSLFVVGIIAFFIGWFIY